MSFQTYKIILNKILSAWPVEEIILTRDGEPLVNPDLEQFIAYACEKGLQVTIGSNGSYFNEKRVEQLIENGLTKVKGDFCSDRKTYEELRRGGNWDSVLKGYQNILEYAIKKSKKFHLILVDLGSYGFSDNKDIHDSLEKLKKLFPYPNDYLSINPAVMHNALNEAQNSLSASKALKKKKYNRCHHPWIELIIDYKGNAVGCCRDLRSEYILGNVFDCDNIVDDIWNGNRMRYLRQMLARKKPEEIYTCAKCDLPYGISYAGRGIIKKYIRFLNR